MTENRLETANLLPADVFEDDVFAELDPYIQASALADLSGRPEETWGDSAREIDKYGNQQAYGIFNYGDDGENNEIWVPAALPVQEDADASALPEQTEEQKLTKERPVARTAQADPAQMEIPFGATGPEIDVPGDDVPGDDQDSELARAGLGESTLESLRTSISAVPQGLGFGLTQLLSNTIGAIIPVLQPEIDKFNRGLKSRHEEQFKDDPVARGFFTVAEIGGQYVLPAVKMGNLLKAMGMHWVGAAALADTLVGFFGTSPNDETIINKLIDADESDPTLSAIRDVLGTDEENNQYANRMKHAAEALVLLGLAEAAARTLLTTAKAGYKFFKTPAGQRLAQATAYAVTASGFSEEAESGGMSKLLRLLEPTTETPKTNLSIDGGLSFPEKDTADRLRLKLQREDNLATKGKAMPGVPNNERVTIRHGAPGSNYPAFVVGKITFDDWKTRTESLLDPEEIAEASKWYDELRGVFTKHTQGDEALADAYMRAWLVAQQNVDVTGALSNVLLQAEQFARHVPIEEMRAGGMPNPTYAIRQTITGQELEGGVGAKISDFVDSGSLKETRSWMGDAAEGGEPFVVDVHTARDLGLVDEQLLNHLRRLGYAEEDLQKLTHDFTDKIADTKYENRAQFGRDLTEHLNATNWQGRSDWKPREVQAVGWTAMNRLTAEGKEKTAEQALIESTRRVTYEIMPGVGSPWEAKFSDRMNNLSMAEQASVTKPVAEKAMNYVRDVAGIDVRQVVHGTGGWTFEGQQYQNVSAVAQALATHSGGEIAANLLGYLLQQTEVWSNSIKAMTKNPKGFAVDFVEKPGSRNLADVDEQKRFWDRVVDADNTGLLGGYHPFVTADGRPGIRILIDSGGKKKAEKVKNLVRGRLTELVQDTTFGVDVIGYEAIITKASNDWRRDKDGGAYLARLANLGVNRNTTGEFNRIRLELEADYEQGLAKAEPKAPKKTVEEKADGT